jgi:hypothetical protein
MLQEKFCSFFFVFMQNNYGIFAESRLNHKWFQKTNILKTSLNLKV